MYFPFWVRYTLAPESPPTRVDKVSEPKPQGGGLLTVDNRDKEWRIQPYLRDGVDPARNTDIATGSPEVGSLLLLDGQWQKVEKMVPAIFEASLAVGGTLSGEHGVGVMKRPYLEHALGTVSIEVQRRIKQALDPSNILNPGKILPNP